MKKISSPSVLIPIIAVILIAGFALAVFQTDQADLPETVGLPEIVNVGVVLPATGDLSSHGQDNTIASELALERFNSHLKSINATWQMKLTIEDSQTDPNIALEKIQSLNSKGINLILGPETSAELRNVKSYSDSNNMLLLSPSSTSPKLAVDDNIFRFVPDDTKQGKVIAKLLEHHGIKVAIPVYRADVWGDGLYESSKISFEKLGGIVDEGIRYSPETTVFSTEASLLSDLITQYNSQYDKSEIAILMIGFSETVHFLNSANSYENLRDVRWFGSDATSNDDIITKDRISSSFAEDTNFISTQFAASHNEIHEQVKNHLIEKIGSAPNNYAYSAYDSLWVLGLTINELQTTDVAQIKETLPGIAKNYVGSLGTITFNEYGDLAIGDYELWSIIDGQWKIIGHYNSGTDTLEFF